jgi:hypothetical protein
MLRESEREKGRAEDTVERVYSYRCSERKEKALRDWKLLN